MIIISARVGAMSVHEKVFALIVLLPYWDKSTHFEILLIWYLSNGNC